MKPSVTELISLLDKPGLLKWANKIGLEGIKLEDYKRESTSKGTSLHKQIENYIGDGTPFENQNHQTNFEKLFKDKSILTVEEDIETEYFVGRIDVRIDGKEKYICDFKSSSYIYLDQKLQLAAYRMAKPEYKLGIIEIPDFKFKPLYLEKEPYEEILKALYKIWEMKQLI